ncbi:methanogenesis marker 17 protein [Methanospirillum stamsii]|uniref:Methanogenesis marker 17 protein n=1 Tax=Methanospirillum stamsii TaxID=1277351 RepID=A0A2V2N4F4_9EURY|nr:methanogenesis marker 17 protein [Methanospirillum stamsii]PWR73480.1 methanogenesis marker 17 protein [Methanospirillum stamsii]
MSTLEYFEVDSTEPVGAKLYRRIASTVITDHNLLKVLDKIRIFIDPGVPIFVAVGITRTVPRTITVSDLAGVTFDENKITLSIADETYLADLLQILWRKYGKDRISQPDRFTIEIILDENESSGDIESLAVADPTEGLFKDLIYSMQVICPEGFRVKKQNFHEGRFWFVASENTLPEDVMPLVNEQFRIMEAAS